MTLPVFTTARCELTKIQNSDLGSLRQIAEDDSFKKFLPELYELLKSTDGCKRFISSFSKYTQDGNGFLWAIRIDFRLVGFIGIMDIPYNSTIFYAIHPSYRCKGIAKECVHKIVSWFDNHYSGGSIHTEIYESNKVSLHIASCFPSITITMK